MKTSIILFCIIIVTFTISIYFILNVLFELKKTEYNVKKITVITRILLGLIILLIVIVIIGVIYNISDIIS